MKLGKHNLHRESQLESCRALLYLEEIYAFIYWSHIIGSTLATHSREALEEVEMGSRAEMMGDPMARADKLRLQKQVLEIQNMPLV